LYRRKDGAGVIQPIVKESGFPVKGEQFYVLTSFPLNVSGWSGGITESERICRRGRMYPKQGKNIMKKYRYQLHSIAGDPMEQIAIMTARMANKRNREKIQSGSIFEWVKEPMQRNPSDAPSFDAAETWGENHEKRRKKA
jgi:hypothetical protein